MAIIRTQKMDRYRELRDRLRGLQSGYTAIWQGIVEKVEGLTCSVRVGGLTVPGVRLRSSLTTDAGSLTVVPKVGTAVTLGSLSGDLSDLVVIAVDHAEHIEASGKITINGGELGGLINIEALTGKLNELVKTFNSHTHQGVHGVTGKPLSSAKDFDRDDYEDEKVKH